MPEEAGRRRDPARGQGRRGAPGDVASSTTRRTPRPPSEELSLLAGMGHELRTVISTLLGYHELLEDGVLGPVPPGAAEAVGRIGDAARELQSMLGGSASAATRETLTRAEKPQQLLALTLGSPEFQRR